MLLLKINKTEKENNFIKINYKNLDNQIKFSETKVINRDEFKEIFERNDIKVKEFLDLEENYQIIDDEKFHIIQEETEKLTFNTNFNNFNRIVSIINLFLLYKDINPEDEKECMKRAYNNMCKKIDIKKGTNCSGMGLELKKILEKKGINSYLVRFGAFGYINDDYIKDGHSGLVIPAKINNEKKFIFLDPGIRIFKPIIFDKNGSNEVFCDGKKFSIIKTPEENKEFDYSLKSIANNGTENYLNFNSKENWLNPDETLIPESLRSRGVYKIQKFNPEENIVFFINIEKEFFSLKLENDLIKVHFYEFIDIFKNGKINENKKLFLKIFEKLGEDEKKIINNIFNIIENLEIFKEVILSPSSKKIIEERKNK